MADNAGKAAPEPKGPPAVSRTSSVSHEDLHRHPEPSKSIDVTKKQMLLAPLPANSPPRASEAEASDEPNITDPVASVGSQIRPNVNADVTQDTAIIPPPKEYKNPGSHASSKTDLGSVHPFFQKRKPEKEATLVVPETVPASPSLIVRLQVSSEKLKVVAAKPERLKSIISKPHPFFQKRRPGDLMEVSPAGQPEPMQVSDPTPKQSSAPNDTPSQTGKERTERPRYVVALKLPKERLKAVKPKVHPFFQRKGSPAGQTPSLASQLASLSRGPTPSPLSSMVSRSSTPVMSRLPWTPFPKFSHVRGLKSDEIPKIGLPKRHSKHKRSMRQTLVTDDENILTNLLSSARGPVAHYTPKVKPQRRLMTFAEIRDVIRETIPKEHRKRFSRLASACCELDAFDRFTCEDQAWTAKYAPSKAKAVVTAGSSAVNVRDWIQRKSEQLKTAAPVPVKRKRGRPPAAASLDNFIVDDEDILDDEPTSNVLVLHGPPGSGKTASVYAAGAELDAVVLELNAGQRRAGRDLLAMLDGISQSTLVHSASTTKDSRDSIILLEEVDLVYEADAGFWPALDQFARVSRRPVVLTCTSTASLPETLTETTGPQTYLEFSPAEPALQRDALWLMALAEGHLLSLPAVESIVHQARSDFRQAANDLQFWCQMGLGGRRSGIDWFLTRGERLALPEPDTTRVISVDTLGQPTTVQTRTSSASEDLATFSARADIAACADILEAHSHSLLAHDHAPPRDNPMSEKWFSEEPLQALPLPFETSVFPHLRRALDGHRTPHTAPVAVDHTVLRDALATLAPARPWLSAQTQTDAEPLPALALDVLPYARLLAFRDRHLRSQAAQLRLASLDSRRATVRSLAAQGIELPRLYLGDTDVDEVLATAPLWYSLA